MKELTIKEIKEKQKQLESDLRKKLNDFYEETGLKARGKIDFGFTEYKEEQWIYLKYDNPF